MLNFVKFKKSCKKLVISAYGCIFAVLFKQEETYVPYQFDQKNF